MDWIIDVSMGVAAIIAVAAGAVSAWRSWQNAGEADRRAIVATVVKEMVLDAEQTYVKPGAGTAKFGWVMGQLSERFPDTDWDELAGAVEAAVTAMHKEKITRSVRHRNGTYDA